MVQKDNANKVQENNAVISSLFNKLVLMGVKNAVSLKFWMEGRINYPRGCAHVVTLNKNVSIIR